jgi:hypothetical protein
MVKKLEVNLQFSDVEYNRLRELFELLAYHTNFHDIPHDLYMEYERLMVTLNTAYEAKVKNQLVADKLETMKEWAQEQCSGCRHEAHDHAYAGAGLCCSEGCPCFKFVKG